MSRAYVEDLLERQLNSLTLVRREDKGRHFASYPLRKSNGPSVGCLRAIILAKLMAKGESDLERKAGM